MDEYYAVNIDLLGHPRITLNDGRRIEIKSKKGLALVALLATADNGERSRAWLQQKLWGAREVLQAQASLRRELSALRKCLPADACWLKANHRSIALDFKHVAIDIRHPVHRHSGNGEFLEGIDIPGEEDFEDWLREMRAYYRRIASALPAPSPFPAPTMSTTSPIGGLEMQVAILAAADLNSAGGPHGLLAAATRSLVESLSRLRWLPIAAPAPGYSPFAAVPHQRSRYIVETDLVRDDQRALLMFTLSEMPHRKLLWSQTVEIERNAGIAELREPLLQVANTIAQTVDRTEQAHRMSLADDPRDLDNLLWRTRYHLQRFTSAGMRSAGQLLRQAAQLTPFNGEVAMLRAHQAIGALWASRAPLNTGGALMPLAREALRGDPTDARGPLFLGILELWQGKGTGALRHFERSCALNPGFPAAHGLLGTTYSLGGEPEKGLEPLERALALSPTDPFRFIAMGELASTQLMLGDHAGCLRLAREIQTTHPNYVLAHVLEVNALTQSGRFHEAMSAYRRLLRTRPALAADTLARIPFRDASLREALKRGIDAVTETPQFRAA